MTIYVIKEEDAVKIKYSKSSETICELLDYSSIDKLIDYIMENSIKDITVEKNDDCKQYVELIESILTKIKEEDFINCYKASIAKEE